MRLTVGKRELGERKTNIQIRTYMKVEEEMENGRAEEKGEDDKIQRDEKLKNIFECLRKVIAEPNSS